MRLENVSEAIKFTKSFLIDCQTQVTISFDIKSIHLSGQFAIKDGNYFLRFNEENLIQNPEIYYLTIIHEVAHFFCYLRYGDSVRPHGKEWKSIVRHLGGTAERCSTYSISEQRKKKKYKLYICPCGKEHWLSPLLDRRVQEGQIRICNKCNNRIWKKD